MCDRSPLFLPEAKSIIYDVLKRTLELFDLSLHLIEHFRLNKYLSEREENHDYHQLSLDKSCKLNYNILSDLDKYLHRLSTSCRLTKSSLRSLYASRLISSNDYIVIDDEIYDLIKSFKNKLSYQIQLNNQFINRRYHSQRKVHSSHTIQTFVFHPETSDAKNNSQKMIFSDEILIFFEKTSRLYQILLEQLYGIHIVRDSDILQPIVINIIRLLLLITNKLKEKIPPIKINRNHFTVQKNEEIC
jgi:hypothetical protein